MTDPTAPAAREDPWVGRTVAGKFRVGELIGKGAMGRVYRGEHLSLGKPVAIKVLHKHLGGDPRIAKRFHREAKAASRLSHPNSLQIIDFGSAQDGTLFIAMELLEGDDLQTIIDRDAPLTPARIGELMCPVLRAIDEAHHAGIIHRDLKPENVVVLRDRGGRERVKVCDFGIAKITESEGRSTAITRDGYVCGTPEYMAPEQGKGDAIDARVDVYAAGVMLYQMLCGKVPFRAETALGIITKHIMDTPRPPRHVQPAWGIPRSLERIALRALEKDPADRFANAAQMARAIEAAVTALGDRADERLGHGSFARAAEEDAGEDSGGPEASDAVAVKNVAFAGSSRQGQRWLFGLPVALAVLGLGVGLWLTDRGPPPRILRPDPDRTEAGEELRARAHRTSPADPLGPRSPEVARGEAPPAPVQRFARAHTTEEIGKRGGSEPAPHETGDEAGRSKVRAPSPELETRTPLHPRPATHDAPRPVTQSALERGREHLLRGELPDAIRSFEEAARMTPEDAQVYRQLGRAYMRHGNVPRGIVAYRRYLTLAPDAPDRGIIERLIAQHED